jgi:Holliday junction resolvase RusA-like endonuclease
VSSPTATSIEFFVPGIPATQGSKRAFYNKAIGRAILVDDCKRNKDWRGDVKAFALKAVGEAPPASGPVCLRIQFYLPRPKGHFGSGRNADKLRDHAPDWHTKKPDLTKMTRAVEDALKGIAWNDDSQVAVQHIEKVYGPSPGAKVFISEIWGLDS